MSINVTVSGNPISIRRGKMVLSDLENIKRIDREHRKRLRREQVQEQSKALAKRLLERARRIRQDELDRLEKDSNTQMRRAHDKKLMEIHRRYQDIENIGYAYENAANQPDIESIKQAEEERNKALARARGAEAAHRLQETNKAVDPKSLYHERLNQVREFENERSRMVAQLPKKSTNVDNSDNENIESTSGTASRRKIKHVVSKKTPIKKVVKHSKVQSKTPSRVSVTINGEEVASSSKKSSVDKSKKSSPSKSTNNVPKKVSDISGEGNVCQSDDNEPRKTIPVTSSTCSRPNRLSHTENYEINSSSDLSSTSSTSSSNDSSYYSDNASKNTAVRVTPRHHTSPITSKVNLYDHNTRQRNTYEMPFGVVERVNKPNERNAEDIAKELREIEQRESASIASQKDRARQRSQDAMVREKIRKDYRDLLKKLEELYKQDIKLQAKQISCDTGQQVLAPSKKSKDNTKRQKKMDRTFEAILRNSQEPAFSDRVVERPITITPRDYVHSKDTPVTGWKEPPYMDGQVSDESSENDEDYHCKKKIIELLMKVEKSKRRLLQEYGDDLPDNIFNAVIKSFDKPTTPANQERTECHNVKSKTPEIQVINMSDCNETNKSAQKIIYKPKKPCNKTPARCVQRPCSKNTVSTCDQQVQVELQDEASKKKEKSSHPIEPVIKIITPENVDSSTSLSSNSSTATDLVIDVNQQGITVDPKDRDGSVKIAKSLSSTSVKTGSCNTPVKISFEKKTGGKSLMVTGLLINPDKNEIQLLTKQRKSSESESKNPSPIVSGACNSLPESRKSSPSKKSSRSAPPSRHSSPKKSPSRSRGSTSRREAMHYRTQYTQVSIDSSTESSQMNSTSDTVNGGKLYTRFQALAAKRVVMTSNMGIGQRQPQDTSDASTVYASPPAPAACAMLNDLNSSTPILELLDSSSANEAIRRRARQVSPVSSPETPSPRTMKLPSNIPRPNLRVNRNLKFSSSLNAHSHPGPSGLTRHISKSTQASYTISAMGNTPTSARTPTATSTGMPSAAATTTTTTTTTTARSSQQCTCRNPMCKLLHERMEEPQSQVLAHCPEILKTYEDLQNVYTERIASLTDLIELVRNEQRGLELSVMAQDSARFTSRSDSNSQSSTSGHLMKNIEAIHAQLKKTLQESQKMISGEGIEISKPVTHSKTSDKTPSTSLDLSKDTAGSESLEEEARDVSRPTTSTTRTKPKIVNEERVNIPLNRFQHSQKSRPSTAVPNCENRRRMPSTTREVAVATNDQSEQMVEMLSKEILEQSKSINKSAPADTLKDSDDSLSKPSQAAVKDSGDSSKNAVSTDEQNQSGNLDTSNSDYVPFLAGIPKISRSKNSSNGRGRPPVTLISGPYRPEIESPGHELSTIVEFDTPDTANKSQASTRSPSNKARKKILPTGELPSTSSSPTKKIDTKVTKNKPSLQVAPLPIHQSPHLSLNISNKSVVRSTERSPKKTLDKSPRRSLEKSPKKSIEKSLRRSSEKLSESLEKRRASKGESGKNISSDSMQTLPDLHIEHLQQSQDNADGNYEFRISQISELQSLPDETIDQMLVSELCEESKSKSITPEQKQMLQQERNEEPEQDKGQLTLTSTASLSGLSGVSEISTTPSSDVQQFKCPSSSDEMELAFKKWGLPGWTIPTLKKTREASALGSSSSSDVTPVNTGSRLVTSAKKQHLHDSTPRELLAEISDVSSISIRNENKSTERSVLVKGRTSTPNRLQMRNLSINSNHSDTSNRQFARNNSNDSNHSERSNRQFVGNNPNISNHSVRSNKHLETNNSNNSNNSDGSVSLSSFSSDLNIVVQNQSADISTRNISFTNNNL